MKNSNFVFFFLVNEFYKRLYNVHYYNLLQMEVLCVDGIDSLYMKTNILTNIASNGTIKKFQWNPLDRVGLSETKKNSNGNLVTLACHRSNGKKSFAQTFY